MDQVDEARSRDWSNVVDKLKVDRRHGQRDSDW